MRIPPPILVVLILLLTGCESIEPIARGIDRALNELTPEHPVTGESMVSTTSESREIAQAQAGWAELVAQAPSPELIDPPGVRLDQINRIFGDLVSVAHRQHLPWQVHLVDHPIPNALAGGGGLVIVFTGLFTDHPAGGGWVRPSDDELAAILAHEIAHNTMMHGPRRSTTQLFSKRMREDDYFQAAYSTEAEAEADRIGILYMTLAGYDPSAAATVWHRAHRMRGSSPGNYLYTHPLNAQRAQMARDVAGQVRVYYLPDRQNPQWAALLDDNVLYRKAQPKAYETGSGTIKAAEAAMKMYLENRSTKKESKTRERAARDTQEYQATLVQLREVRYDQQGRPILWLHVANGSKYPITALGFTIDYLGLGNQMLWQDSNCGGPVRIDAGEAMWLECPVHGVQGVQNFQARVAGVQF